MKRVLIVAYYWPPSAGSGVQRWLKFVKYLPQFGWQPVVVTPSNPDFSVYDEKLLNDVPKQAEVLKIPIWEPYSFGRKIFGKKKDAASSAGVVSKSKGGFKNYIENWIRGNVFIPDPKVYWRKDAVNYILNYIEKHPVDAIVTTGTPHSLHLIGLDVSRKTKLPWFADFRDPFSQLDMLDSYHILPFRYKKYLKYEQQILRNASHCITTSKLWAEDFKDLGAKRVTTITNGFDQDDFKEEVVPYNKFVVSHFGLMNHLRNPKLFWKSLDSLCEENSDFANKLFIHLGGTIAAENLEEIQQYRNLKNKVKVFPYLKHEEVVKEYLKSSLLLLLLFNSNSGKGNIPGKVFEYLAAKKPIIAFGSANGDSSEIVEQSGAGEFFTYSGNEEKNIKSFVLNVFKDNFQLKTQAIEQFSRKQLTEKLAKLLCTEKR